MAKCFHSFRTQPNETTSDHVRIQSQENNPALAPYIQSLPERQELEKVENLMSVSLGYYSYLPLIPKPKQKASIDQ